MVDLTKVDIVTMEGIWHMVIDYCVKKDVPLPNDNTDESLIVFLKELETSNPVIYNKLSTFIDLYIS